MLSIRHVLRMQMMTSTAKQVVKTALQGGIVYTSRGFSILGVFIFWFLAFFRFFVADCRLSPGQMAVGADE